MTDELKDIAKALTSHAEYTLLGGYKVGSGCPFGDFGYTLEQCCACCAYLFPRLKNKEDIRKMDCPCFQFTKKWVVRRCRTFVKEVMTDD